MPLEMCVSPESSAGLKSVAMQGGWREDLR